MPSEMRRVAKALVESRSESYRSRHPLDESKARLEAALARVEPDRTRFERAWTSDAEGVVLEARFVPSRRTQRFLQASSIVLTLLILSSAWALVAPGEERSARFLVPLVAVLAILAFPFVVVALGSQREAEEARIRKAIRRALTDEDESRADRSR